MKAIQGLGEGAVAATSGAVEAVESAAGGMVMEWRRGINTWNRCRLAGAGSSISRSVSGMAVYHVRKNRFGGSNCSRFAARKLSWRTVFHAFGKDNMLKKY
jgi:hypothetical protein